MRKSIALAVLLFGLVTFAQEKPVDGKGKNAKTERSQTMTAEQRAELQVKKMTLELDLTPKQQIEIQKLVLAQAKKREAQLNEMKSKKEKGEKPTDEERFNNKSRILDEQIAMKAEFKKILTAEQMVKFEENSANRSEKMQERRRKGKREGMEKK